MWAASGVLDDWGEDICYGTGTVTYNDVNVAHLRTKRTKKEQLEDKLLAKTFHIINVKKQSMYLFDHGIVRRYISSS